MTGPGTVRELENINPSHDHASESGHIDADVLPPRLTEHKDPPDRPSTNSTAKPGHEVEAYFNPQDFAETHGDRSLAAKSHGIRQIDVVAQGQALWH